ncbi:MAG: hypothetical protein ACK5JT_14515 [Hyphomicrobiaceae bacterium]
MTKSLLVAAALALPLAAFSGSAMAQDAKPAAKATAKKAKAAKKAAKPAKAKAPAKKASGASCGENKFRKGGKCVDARDAKGQAGE